MRKIDECLHVGLALDPLPFAMLIAKIEPVLTNPDRHVFNSWGSCDEFIASLNKGDALQSLE